MANNRGGLSQREYDAKMAGKPMPYDKSASSGGFSSAGSIPASPGATPGGAPSGGAPSGMTDLGNLKQALRSALNEAASKRVANNYSLVAPIAGGVPGSIGSVVSMIRAGVKSPVETTFSDVVQTFKDANDAKQVEIDSINKLRLEYGSAIPAGVTSLSDAIKYVTPLIDQKRRLELQKTAGAIQSTNDVESAAQMMLDQGGKMTGITGTNDFKSKVRIRYQQMATDAEQAAKDDYFGKAAGRIERAGGTPAAYKAEEETIYANDNLTWKEQQESIERINALKAQKEQQKTGGIGGGINWFQNPFKTLDQGLTAASKYLQPSGRK